MFAHDDVAVESLDSRILFRFSCTGIFCNTCMVSPLMSLSCVLEAEDVDGLELEPDPDDPEPGGADSTTWTALPSILPLSESSFILSCNTRPEIKLDMKIEIVFEVYLDKLSAVGFLAF